MRTQKSTGINPLATLIADRKRKQIFKILAAKFVNPGRALYLVLLVPISAYLIREVFRPVIVIDSFGTPKDMQELGITSETFANRVGDKLRVVESDRKIMMTKDLPLSFEEIGELPAIEVPGSKLDLKSLIASARTILGVYPKHISGDIVEVVKEDANRRKEA